MLSLAVVGAYAEDQPSSLDVAIVQMPISDDWERNRDRMRHWIEEAAEQDAEVVVFPETVLSGFSKQAVSSWGEDARAAGMADIAALADEHDLYVIYGTATPSRDALPFNSAIIVDPQGREVTRYHKMIPEPWFEPGDHPAFFEIAGVPATVIICHDNRFPELVRLPVLAGAKVCFYISYEINGLKAAVRKQENYRSQLIGRAAENGIFVVQANGVGPEGGESQSLGQSRIIAPNGTVLDEAPALEETMIVRRLDLREAGRGNALESLESKFFAEWWKLGLEQMEAWNRGQWYDTGERRKPRSATRLALMQHVPVKWDLEANFEVFLDSLDDAEGADFFITPECWLDGYAAPDKASTPDRLRAVAQPLEGSAYLDRVSREARERKMHICFGFTSLIDGAIYNSSGLWNPEGELIGIYHKTHLQTHDLQYSTGMDLPVWETDVGPVGTMICADRRWPETARSLRLKGARLILNPTYGMHHLDNEWWMRTRGYENQCFIAFAHPETSFVVNPWGDLECKRAKRPGVLICDIDLNEVRDDNHIRDRRPDLYQAITLK